MADRDIRVLLVDDQELVRTGIATILAGLDGIEVVGQAADGASALAETRRLDPDVVCMDVQMPDMDGLEATRRLTADPALRAAVLVLTTFQREDYLLEALQAGASGFLLKNARPAQLADAIRSVAAGDALLAPEMTRAVLERALGAATARDDGTAQPVPAAVGALTDRELEVLGLMARGLSNDEVAGRLFLGRATVKTHVSNVLMKLGLRDRVQAVVFAHEHGLVAPDSPTPDAPATHD